MQKGRCQVPRGEEQKPVTNSYRDSWDRIFGLVPQDSSTTDTHNEECDCVTCTPERHKAPTVKSEPCGYCGGSGDSNNGGDIYDEYERCVACGGLGFVEPSQETPQGT